MIAGGILFVAILVSSGTLFATNLFLRAHAQSYTGTSGTLAISPSILPNGTEGASYSETLSVVSTATTTSGPFSWSVINGSLPSGLALDTATTGTSTMISGTPDSLGTFTFTVNVTNGSVAATQTYIMNIDPGETAAATTSAPTSTAPTSTASLVAEIEAIAAQIQTLEAELASSAPSAPGASVTGTTTAFYRNLTIGDSGPDVEALQQYLNRSGFPVAAKGPGSAGNETQYFGPLTQTALASWQAAHGISPAAGYFGPETRAKIAATAAAPFIPAPSSSAQ